MAAKGRMVEDDSLDRDILVVDDEESVRDLIATYLIREGFRVDTASDGKAALDLIRERRYFLVITDVGMPGLSGLELLSEVRAKSDPVDPHFTDVVIVTGNSGESVAIEALRRGAYDYFRKPFSLNDIGFTLRRLLERRRLRRSAHEFHTLRVRLQTEKEHAEQAMAALVEAVYAKDRYTRGHMQRVGEIAARLGRYMGKSEADVEILYRSGTLHDIGKIGTPDQVLNKPASLSPTEWETIHLHPVVGANILAPIRALNSVCVPVRCHHERWDGSGYPECVGGTDIPELARVMAVADVCDALYSDRAYRAGLPQDTVREIILDGRGQLFDPDACDALEDLCEKGEVFEPLASARSDRRVADDELSNPC